MPTALTALFSTFFTTYNCWQWRKVLFKHRLQFFSVGKSAMMLRAIGKCAWDVSQSPHGFKNKFLINDSSTLLHTTLFSWRDEFSLQLPINVRGGANFLKGSHRIGDGRILLKTSVPHSLINIYLLKFLLTRSISVTSTCKHFEK